MKAVPVVLDNGLEPICGYYRSIEKWEYRGDFSTGVTGSAPAFQAYVKVIGKDFASTG